MSAFLILMCCNFVSVSENSSPSFQARFILEKCDGSLVIENKKKKDMIAELQRKGYDSDPVKAWKKLQDLEAALVSTANYFNSLCCVQGSPVDLDGRKGCDTCSRVISKFCVTKLPIYLGNNFLYAGNYLVFEVRWMA